MTAVHDCEIFATRRAGAYTVLTVVAADLAAAARPGQLISIAVGGADSALVLRRTVPIAAAAPSGVYAGTVQFLVGDDDAGQRWLARRPAGQTLQVIGPVGTAFTAVAGPVVLVGVGAGAAPVLFLAQHLIAAGVELELLLGAADAAHLYGEPAAKRLAARVAVSTEDGSAGHHGPVAELVPDAIARTGARAVYACAPPRVSAAVARTSAGLGVPAEVALVDDIPCGTGLCAGCVLPVGDGARACVEGPVFAADRVRWDELPGVPARRGSAQHDGPLRV